MTTPHTTTPPHAHHTPSAAPHTPTPTTPARPTSAPPAPIWTDRDLVNPHAEPDKAKRVCAMFNAIAPSYDLNNRLHSMGQDQAWRKKSVRHAHVKPTDVVLDVACGTGDLSMAFANAQAKRVIGMDFTHAMLTLAERKRNHNPQLAYQTADAMRLPLPDHSVDIVSIAFGIRNVADPQIALQEFARVLRPGGRLIILEFSLPTNRLLRSLFNFYFTHIMSRTCAWIAGDRSGAYRYLARSVNTFMGRHEMVERITAAGLTDVTTKPLTFGIAVIYRGIKSA